MLVQGGQGPAPAGELAADRDVRDHWLLVAFAEGQAALMKAPVVTSAADGAGWLAFFRDLTARGLTGVALVNSDGRSGLVE